MAVVKPPDSPRGAAAAPPAAIASHQLREAVERLGRGFLQADPRMAGALADGQLTLTRYWDELVRLSLQLIVLAIAEGRGVLFRPGADLRRYHRECSLAGLCRPAPTAEDPAGRELWRARATVLDVFGDRQGGLFARTAGRWEAGFLLGWALGNADLRAAGQLLLGQECMDRWGAYELGSVRELLLELEPRWQPGSSAFSVTPLSAVRRLAGGVYYTPPAVVEAMLNLALDPVIDRYARADDPGSLLRILVIDPACGAGVFLEAAARRLARRYAALLAGDPRNPDPPAAAVRFAQGVILECCIRGIDLDPVAVALTKAALWLLVAPGRPMSFLDRDVICGDALAGPDPWAAADMAGAP